VCIRIKGKDKITTNGTKTMMESNPNMILIIIIPIAVISYLEFFFIHKNAKPYHTEAISKKARFAATNIPPNAPTIKHIIQNPRIHFELGSPHWAILTSAG